MVGFLHGFLLSVVLVKMERPLNVYTSQNPRQHVVFIEIQPNAYNKYPSQTAGVTLIFSGVVSFCIFEFCQYSGCGHISKSNTLQIQSLLFLQLFPNSSNNLLLVTDGFWRSPLLITDYIIPLIIVRCTVSWINDTNCLKKCEIHIYKNLPSQDKSWREDINKQRGFPPNQCTYCTVRIWLVFTLTTRRLGFCPVYTFNGKD
jgi:hypothetical protein